VSEGEERERGREREKEKESTEWRNIKMRILANIAEPLHHDKVILMKGINGG